MHEIKDIPLTDKERRRLIDVLSSRMQDNMDSQNFYFQRYIKEYQERVISDLELLYKLATTEEEWQKRMEFTEDEAKDLPEM